MKFLTEDDELLKNIAIPGKKKNIIKKEFDSEPTCKQMFLKTKMKSYE